MGVLYWSDDWSVDRNYVLSAMEKYGKLDGREILEVFLTKEMPGKIALVSSFGAEAAILLHMISEIDKSTPVVFLDTLKLFQETLDYRDRLIDKLGLTGVMTIRPAENDLKVHDSKDDLWKVDPDTCCNIRKTVPLDRALEGFKGWITGRKRVHGGERSSLPVIEMSKGRIKLNPLAFWGQEDLDAAFEKYDLPRHPLVQQGYTSIGCATCTAKPVDKSDPRSGRWAHIEGKTECGIHIENGKVVRINNG